MNDTLLYFTNIVTPIEVIAHGALGISKGKIDYIGSMEDLPHSYATKLDLREKYLAPGFIDMHVHGGIGISFDEIDNLELNLQTYSKWVASTGVTGFLCSIAAPDAKALAEKIERYVGIFEKTFEGAQPLGLHLEGPYLNKQKKGAFNPAWLRMPSLEEAKSFIEAGSGWIRQMTLAPELPGAQEIAALYRSHGILISLGHTDSNYETASAALKGNFTHVTHTFNAQSGFHHRQPGAFGAIMASDEVTAELIADTIHAHPGAMKILVRCLGTDRIVLITDAMPGAGLADGVYELVGLQVTVKNGHANLPDGTIAGSTVLLNQCVRNVNQLVGVPFPEAIKMASLNPARTMGISNRLGSIAVGKEANLVVLDQNADVLMTMVKGKIVFNNL